MINKKPKSKIVKKGIDFEAVKRFVLRRVRAAVKSGKVIRRHNYFIEARGEACAIGAIAVNGNDRPNIPEVSVELHDMIYDLEGTWVDYDDLNAFGKAEIYAITVPLLMKLGVPMKKAPHLLEAIEAGFEGWRKLRSFPTWSWTPVQGLDATSLHYVRQTPLEKQCYELGKYIYETYAK